MSLKEFKEEMLDILAMTIRGLLFPPTMLLIFFLVYAVIENS